MYICIYIYIYLGGLRRLRLGDIKNMFWKVFGQVGVDSLPTKGLEQLKKWYDITYGNLLPKRLKMVQPRNKIGNVSHNYRLKSDCE